MVCVHNFSCLNFRGFYFCVSVVGRENRENLDLAKISRYKVYNINICKHLQVLGYIMVRVQCLCKWFWDIALHLLNSRLNLLLHIINYILHFMKRNIKWYLPMIANLLYHVMANLQSHRSLLGFDSLYCTWHSFGVLMRKLHCAIYPYSHQKISLFSSSNSLHTITSVRLAHSSVCDGCNFPGRWWCDWHFCHHWYLQKWVGSIILYTVQPPIFRLLELHLGDMYSCIYNMPYNTLTTGNM